MSIGVTRDRVRAERPETTKPNKECPAGNRWGVLCLNNCTRAEAGMEFKEAKQWPRRVFFLGTVVSAALVYDRFFSVLLIAIVFATFEVILTRIDNNRKVISEFFQNYVEERDGTKTTSLRPKSPTCPRR